MKTIKELEELNEKQIGINKVWNCGRIRALKDVIKLIDERITNCISKDVELALRQLKVRIEG